MEIAIDIQGLDLAQSEESLFANSTIFGQRLQAIGMTALDTEDTKRETGILLQHLISDMQSFFNSQFRKDSISDRTGIPGTGFPFESLQAAVA